MSKEIANFFWHGFLNDIIKKCIKSYHEKGFECRLWSYEGHEIEGIKSFDANEIIDLKGGDVIGYEYYGYKVPIVRVISDIFRFNLLCKKGGWWFDTDSFCLKDVSEFKKLKEGRDIVCAYESSDKINNDSIYLGKRIRKSFYINYIDYLQSINIHDHIATGPLALTDIIHRLNLESQVLKKETFHPIHFDEMEYFSKESNIKEGLNRIKGSYSFHLWNSHLMNYNIKPTLINYL
jgi:mannosyltransferase OCH1-like enzyme